jgi:serine/threonine-protein kinase
VKPFSPLHRDRALTAIVDVMTGSDLLGGRYELRGVLGYGGMAEVRDGWDRRLGRAVAIKLLHPTLSAKPDVRSRFEEEARAAARLAHPNIVAVHDYGHHGDTPYIVMERLQGSTLDDEIRRGPLPPMRVRSVLDDVLAALAVAHAAGVVHRDVKPGNILTSGTGGAVKLADFGIAKSADAAHTATGQLVGTMAYTSPERLSGAASSVVDDLYAVGVVGYEAAAGRRPFPQADFPALAVAILDGSHAPLASSAAGIDPVLVAVIERAISRDPRARFASADQMRAALAGMGAAMPVTPLVNPPRRVETRMFTAPFAPPSSVHPVSAPRASRPWTRRRKVLMATGLLTALVVTTLAFALEPSPDDAPATISTPVTTTSSPSPTPPPVTPTVVRPVEPQGPPPGRGNGNGKDKGPKDRDD